MKMEFGYRAIFDRTLLEETVPEERFGDWYESYSNRLDSVELVGSSIDAISNVIVDPGETVIAVWLEYSTGDSFGHGDKNSVQLCGVFKEHKSAEELAAFLSSTTGSGTCHTSDGQIFEYKYFPWQGYFETLEEVHVETVLVTAIDTNLI
jgi:hypothetical protein